MSLKQEIETWVQALDHYDNNEFEESLGTFGGIADTSKILFNCGVIYATLGEHYKAVDYFQQAIALDKYLAIAYFQQGVSNFLIGDFEEALANFNDTLLYLRGNTSIDYAQLGLKFKLYSCEVLFNRGLCYIYMRDMDSGMKDLHYASKEKAKPEQDVIDEAITEQAEGYTVFSIPIGVVYRPSEAKVKNLKTKEYLGKARLVAASDRGNIFTGFHGSEIKKANLDSSKDDRPPEAISYAATNLVQRNMSSRGRQQSEPPVSRNTFPPTPPPESEKISPHTSHSSHASHNSTGSSTGMSARSSVRGARPPVLDLRGSGETASGANGMDGANGPAVESKQNMPPGQKQRIGGTRTASEPRGPPLKQRPSRGAHDRPPNGKLLYRETTRNQGGRHNSNFRPVSEDGDPNYDGYGNGHPVNPRGMRRPGYIEEEDEECDTEACDSDSCSDDMHFEMVGSPPPTQPKRQPTSRRPEVQKLRVKVHADKDTRFVIIIPAIEFGAFEGKIRDKFGFKAGLRISMRDDGDMVTLGDQDDLDLLIATAKQEAKRGRKDMGKMEVWVTEK